MTTPRQFCDDENEALTLKVPKDGLEVVQHVPRGSAGRDHNTLYLAPRRIRDEEFKTAELNALIDRMYAVMQAKSGVGIAANQIGKRLQLFIIEAKVDNPRYKVLGPVARQVFINPTITQVSTLRKNFWHGCLSAHGEPRGNLASFEWIEYECQNEQGEMQKGRLDGFASVIFQHEFRHLMGGTYLDLSQELLEKEVLEAKIAQGELPFFEWVDESLPLMIKGYQLGSAIEETSALDLSL
jgi:peptide deformylase